MNSRERITSYFIEIKIFAALLILSAPFVVYLQDKMFFLDGMVICVPFWILGGILLFIAKTRNVVYFDGKVFYLHNWKGQLTLTVPCEKIISIYYLPIKGNPIKTYIVRYYDASNKDDKFYIFPRWNINFNSIAKRIKAVNPGLIN